MWLHMKVCMKKGVTKYLSDFANLHEMAIIALFLAIFVLQWNGRILVSQLSIFGFYCEFEGLFVFLLMPISLTLLLSVFNG